MSDLNITKVVELDLCCGCAACSAICPMVCVRMTTDQYGFVVPDIDLDQCIECGLCVKCCPFSCLCC